MYISLDSRSNILWFGPDFTVQPSPVSPTNVNKSWLFSDVQKGLEQNTGVKVPNLDMSCTWC